MPPEEKPPTRAEIEEALKSITRVWNVHGTLGYGECELVARALRQLLAATEDTERLDSGRICLRITDNMQHEWTGIDLRSAIDSARGRK